MSYKVIFTPEANDDLTEILGWYSSNHPSETKRRFIGDMSKMLQMLQKAPKIYTIRFKHARCAVLKKYPFNIYYWVDDADSTINIFAILHQKRNPSIWEKRL